MIPELGGGDGWGCSGREEFGVCFARRFNYSGIFFILEIARENAETMDKKRNVMQYKLVLDQGTEKARALIVDDGGEVVNVSEREFHFKYYKDPVHNQTEVLTVQMETLWDAIKAAKLSVDDISAFAIINRQLEVIVWEWATASFPTVQVEWQGKRCNLLNRKNIWKDTEKEICKDTGRPVNYCFSPKWIKMMLDWVPPSDFCCGTEDSWLIFVLTGGCEHVTDLSNALGTTLVDPDTQDWDPDRLAAWDIPVEPLPRIVPDGSVVGDILPLYFGKPIPIIVGATEESLGISQTSNGGGK